MLVIYILLVLVGALVSALAGFMLYLKFFAETQTEVHARLRREGWSNCPICGELARPPADGKHCHGCSRPYRRPEGHVGKCVCSTCYAAHLASE